LLTFDDVPKEVFTRWDITEHQVNQHLLNESLTGTPEIVADLLTFPPGFVHHMHRHPHADMIVVPLTGNLKFLGDLDRTEVLHIFSGVGAVEDIGYEPHPNQFSITR
jgi:quercetin dioxygenase-like cupin family protein